MDNNNKESGRLLWCAHTTSEVSNKSRNISKHSRSRYWGVKGLLSLSTSIWIAPFFIKEDRWFCSGGLRSNYQLSRSYQREVLKGTCQINGRGSFRSTLFKHPLPYIMPRDVLLANSVRIKNKESIDKQMESGVTTGTRTKHLLSVRRNGYSISLLHDAR